jgi:hypothetical protein
MSDIAKREFEVLAVDGSNYLKDRLGDQRGGGVNGSR